MLLIKDIDFFGQHHDFFIAILEYYIDDYLNQPSGVKWPLGNSVLFGPIKDFGHAYQNGLGLVALLIELNESPPCEQTGTLVRASPILLFSEF